MQVNRRFIILMALTSLILSSCALRKHKEVVMVRDTVITPPIVKLDTVTQFNDRIVYLQDSTGQLTVTVEKIKNNYIRVKGKCQPEKIMVPISKTIVKTKEVIVKNKFFVITSLFLFLLLLILSFYIYIKKLF